MHNDIKDIFNNNNKKSLNPIFQTQLFSFFLF